jgi:hypothetical protein
MFCFYAATVRLWLLTDDTQSNHSMPAGPRRLSPCHNRGHITTNRVYTHKNDHPIQYAHTPCVPPLSQTCTCAAAAEQTGLRHVNVGDIVKAEQCHSGRDAAFDTLILDEEKLLDALEPALAGGGCVVDFHSCDVFPQEWFDLVLVLRADTKVRRCTAPRSRIYLHCRAHLVRHWLESTRICEHVPKGAWEHL